MGRVAVLAIVAFFVQIGVGLSAGPTSGNYAGTTSQGHPIQLDVRHGTVVSVSYMSHFNCKPSSVAQPVQRTNASGSLTIDDGKFAGKLAVTPQGTTVSDSTLIQGSFKGSKVTGAFSETWKPGPTKACKTGTVRFSASGT